jgi:competence protein ComEC
MLVFVFISRLKIMLLFAVMAGLAIGLWRGTLTRVDLTAYHDWLGQTVLLRGTIKEDPDFGSAGSAQIKIINVEVISSEASNDLTNDHFVKLPGQIWASVLMNDAMQNMKRSDQITVSGSLKPGFGTFPATISFGSIVAVEHSLTADPARDIRDAFGEKLRSVIPSPAADLGMGILAGQKAALPADLTAAFLAASLTHIVVASGYNLTILIRFTRRLFARISRFAALGFGGLLVFVFASITGFSPSMTRAGLVASLSLLVWYYGRKFHPVVLLSLVASITIAIDPTSLWGDAGWWMSFLSFVGVIILAPLLKSYFWGEKSEKKAKQKQPSSKNVDEKSHPLRQIFLETLSAQIMAAPIIALFMGQFSPYGIIANLLILWLLPFTMLATFIAGIGAFFLPHALAGIIAWPATQLLKYIIAVANWIAGLPGASQTIQPNTPAIVIIFTIIFCVVLYLKRVTKHSFRNDNIVE